MIQSYLAHFASALTFHWHDMTPEQNTGSTRVKVERRLGPIIGDPFAIRLAAYTGILMLFIFGLLGFDLWRGHVQGKTAAGEQAAAMARAIDERVVRTLRVADQLLKVVGEELKDKQAWSNARTATHILRRLDPHLDEILTLSFVDARGLCIAQSNPAVPAGFSYLDRDYFHAHLAAPDLGLFVDQPALGRASGQRIFTVSRGVWGGDGHFLGVLAAAISTDTLAADFADTTIGKKGAVNLFHIPSQRIIVRQPDYQAAFGNILRYQDLSRALAQAPSGVFSGDASFDGEARVFAYRKIGALPLAVSVGVSPGDMRANLLHMSAAYLTMALLLSLLIGGGALFILATYRREVGLQESMRRWQQIFEHAGWGIAVGSADGKTLEQMNPAYAHMHGYRVEELTGLPIETVYAPEARKNIPANIALNHVRGQRRFESLHQHRDGHLFPVVVDATTVRDTAGEVLYRVVNVQDISEIRSAQEAMRIAREFFQQTFDAAPVGMAIADVSGRYTQVNRAMCKFTGYSESELLAMNHIDITHPEDVEKNIDLRRSLFEGKCQSFQMEKRYLRKGGREIWALIVVSLVSDSAGRPLYSIGQMLDIDGQKRAEEALRVSEERFRKIFENANTGIAATDKCGRIIDCNEAFRGMLGYEAEALKQMHYADISFPDDIAGEEILFNEILRGQRDKYRLEKRYIACDGRILWVDLCVSTIRDERGGIVNFIGVISDITERKVAALALTESRQQLRALAAYHEAMLELERKHIAREVHDELGQLLTALKMDLSLVRLRFGENLPLLGMVEEMRSLVDRTINVVRQVASNLRPAALDLGLTPAIEWLADDFARRWSIQCTLDAGGSASAEIVLDDLQSTAVFRVVQESLTNVARHAQARKVAITLHASGQRLLVVIRDDGLGFDMAVVGKALGFGLFGMRERMLALGGTLRVDSSPGKGTAVTIELPILNGEHS